MFLHPLWISPAILRAARLGQSVIAYARVERVEGRTIVEGIDAGAIVERLACRSTVDGIAVSTSVSRVSAVARVQ